MVAVHSQPPFSAAAAPKADTSNKPFAKELLVPFWLMRSTGDKDRANMAQSTLKCTTSIAAGKEEHKGDAVFLPTLQNTKVLKEGDELLTYDGDLVKPAHTIEPAPAPEAAASTKKRLDQPVRKRAAASQPPMKKAMKTR